MSANEGNADSGYPTGTQYTFGSKSHPVLPRGMELSRSTYSSQSSVNQSKQEPATMSTLTMRAPNMLPSPRDIGDTMPWDRRPLELPSRPRSSEREELPSLRQVCLLPLFSVPSIIDASSRSSQSLKIRSHDRNESIALIPTLLYLDLVHEEPHLSFRNRHRCTSEGDYLRMMTTRIPGIEAFHDYTEVLLEYPGDL